MTTTLIVVVVVLVGAALQRVSGMGLGLVAGPILGVVIGPVDGIMVVNALALINAVFISFTVRRNINWRRFGIISSVLVFGSVPGALLISQVSADALLITVGVLLLVGLGVTTFGLSRVPVVSGTAPMLATGVAAGFMNTVAGLAGPAITVFAQANRWEQKEYAATLQPIFAVAASISLLVKTLTGAGSVVAIDPSIWVGGVVAMLLGITVGGFLSKRVEASRARLVALILAATGGVLSLVRGLSGMV